MDRQRNGHLTERNPWLSTTALSFNGWIIKAIRGVLSLETKQLEHETDHLPPSSTELNV
jgi:hypothetical protein